ncbi:MAG: hypothetical protein WA151_24515 [Desulfatirhabdiaceae bacterium]|jgi:hypothetical protein
MDEREIREDICRRLRETSREFGRLALNGAIIIGPYDLGDGVGGHGYIQAPTLGGIKLAKVIFKVARYFEDVSE